MQRDKIPVAILGATGSVGQKFVQLLDSHPWFEVTALAASKRSQNKKYSEAVGWSMPTPIPAKVSDMLVQSSQPNLPCKIVFSGLDSSVAGEIETDFAHAGYLVVSNSKNHRLDAKVPLLVPEINSDHLDIIKYQDNGGGAIVTNPNCSTVGLVLALKPLLDNFGLQAVHVVTLQALSGAGNQGRARLDMHDNVLPYIGGEEQKLEREPLKILGKYEDKAIQDIDLKISAHCNRVGVSDGHLECVSVQLKDRPSKEAVKAAWRRFTGEPQSLILPSAPIQPIYYCEEEAYPQPKIHRDTGKGMSVTIGRLRECKLLDYKFVLLVHNTVRGAAGGAILSAELIVKKGLLDGLRVDNL